MKVIPMIETNIELQNNETLEEYINRVLLLKALGRVQYTWETLSNIIFEQTGIDKDESTWRKRAKVLLLNSSNIKAQDPSVNEESSAASEQPTVDEMREVLFEYQKERYKMSDVNTQTRAYMRRIAREETIKEIALEAAKQVGSIKILKPYSPIDYYTNSKNEAILQLSDWHYGIDVNNFWNVFNPEICVERVAALKNEVIHFCKMFGVRKLHVVNLSDLIAGRIHSTIRLESRCDVITQTIKVAEILAEFLTDISDEDIKIEYYDCLDNHSRLEPIKAESLDLESLVRIIPWYLKTRLEYQNVTIHENVFSDDIITFKVLDGKYTVGGVHGHKDKPGKVVDSLTLMTKINYDLILTAHYHHWSGDEKNETLVLSNGSLMGTDAYAKDLRLSSKPSQNITLVTEKSVMDYVHRIVL
jgi:hypothetical protein